MQSTYFLLFILFFPDKGLQTKLPRSNNRAVIVVGIKWNLSVVQLPSSTQRWSTEKEKKSQKMSLWYNVCLCQTAGWYIANKMVNVGAMKLNPCSVLRARPNLLRSLAGSSCVLGEESKRTSKKAFSVLYKRPRCYQFKLFQSSALSFCQEDRTICKKIIWQILRLRAHQSRF